MKLADTRIVRIMIWIVSATFRRVRCSIYTEVFGESATQNPYRAIYSLG